MTRAAGHPQGVAPPRPKRERDDRMDVAKGLLQLMIFVAHVPQSWAILLLHRNISWSDASEIFVFTAGHALGGVFAHRAARDGARAAMLDLLGRSARLYRRFLVLAVGLSAFGFGVAWLTGSGSDLAWQQLGPVADAPVEAALRLLVLSYQPAVLDALALFVVLLPLAAVPTLVPRRIWPVAAALSIGAWGFAQTRWAPLLTWPGPEPWVFDPFAWQLLFLAGAGAGRLGYDGERILPRGLLFPWACAALIGFAAVVTGTWTVHLLIDPGVHPWFFGWRNLVVEKQWLGPLTVLHALALISLVAVAVPSSAKLFRSKVLAAIGLCGRHSLDVFCAGLVASAVGRAVMETTGGTWPWQLVVPPLGWAALLTVGAALERRRARA